MDELKERPAVIATEQSNAQSSGPVATPAAQLPNSQPPTPAPSTPAPSSTQASAPIPTRMPKAPSTNESKAPLAVIFAAMVIVLVLIAVAYLAYTKSK